MQYENLQQVLVSGTQIARDPLRTSFADAIDVGLDQVADARAVIFGVPFDLGTQHHVGTYLGPVGVRRAFGQFRPYSVELGIDFIDHIKVADIGNISVQDYKTYEETFERIDAVVSWIAEQDKLPIMIGGDDSVTFPAVRAFARRYEHMGLLWLDAHFDCAESFRGDTSHCGCPLRNLITRTEGVISPENVVHIGSRSYANYAATSTNARDLGFVIRTAEDVEEHGPRVIIQDALDIVTQGTDAFWLAVDIDVLDAVHAPGTQAPRPGGLTSRELLTMVREAGMRGAAGLSVVEVAPPRDIADMTSTVAAATVMELLGAVAARSIPDFSRPVARAITGGNGDLRSRTGVGG
jgi:agmatinase